MRGVFIDSDVFIGAFNKRDGSHVRASELLKKALGGAYGEAYTSDFILDEVISRLVGDVEKGRLRKREVVEQVESSIQNSMRVRLIHVDEFAVGVAKTCFSEYYDKFLSLTDWSIAVLIRRLGIEHIMSFDHHFDTIKGIKEFSFVKRIH